MDDTQRYILLIASQFPLAFLFQQIPAANAAQRHLFSIVTSSVLILTVYDSFCLLNIMSATFYTFLLTSFFGRLKFTPWLVFGLLMSHMTFVHYVHQIAYPDSIDGSATMMVLVMKLSSFAWSVFDGGQTKLSLDQRQHKIDKMPSLLTLYGYSFFFLGVWIGPAIEFTVYHDFVNEKGPFDQPRFSRSRIFRTLVLGLGIFYLSSTVFQQFDPASDLKEYSFIYKLFYLHMAAIGFRLKFMAGWKLVESACLTTRLGFNKIDPKTNRPSFDRCQNVDIMRVEFAENVKMLAESWNHYTHLWLRRTVYDRFSENKSVANVATYLTSALWHGFYPGYYFGFLSGSLLTLVGRQLRKHVRPLFLARFHRFKTVYDILGCILTSAMMGHLFLGVPLRTVEATLRVWRDTYFIGHLICFGILLVLNGSGKKKTE